MSILLSKGSKSQTVSGRVVSSPEVNPGGYPGNVILIELQDPGELLGTGGEAKVSYTLLTEVFTVPSGALKTRDGVSYVELLEGDAVRTRNVVRGPAAGGYVAVLQGGFGPCFVLSCGKCSTRSGSWRPCSSATSSWWPLPPGAPCIPTQPSSGC